MDGYAVRAEDVRQLPATLTLIGEAFAGARFGGELKSGEAVRIFTGAPVPKGADAVVMQEDAELVGSTVTVKVAAGLGRHIRPCGRDFHEGEVLLVAGTRLGPQELVLAAAMNHAEVPVRRKPKVAILATGDEVMPPGTELGPDEIVSSIPYGLAALVGRQGGEAAILGIAKDDIKSIVGLARAGRDADILLTIGGASVGDKDLVAAALGSEGLALDFWKIAMRPGKPLLYGRLGPQRVLGVPGNPVSALICGLVFLVPMLSRMLGLKKNEQRLFEAVLAENLEENGPREHYMRAVSELSPEGNRLVRPLPRQDSSLMADFARADCLIVRPPHAPALPEGHRVPILPLDF
jgi:molybdopterin molybdotransferase